MGNYAKAVELYSEAIELNENSAIYFSNRAFCHMKMENYGLALIDANDAINIDPNYPKGYYRKADANIAMNKYKDALESLKKVINPKNYNNIAKFYM